VLAIARRLLSQVFRPRPRQDSESADHEKPGIPADEYRADAHTPIATSSNGPIQQAEAKSAEKIATYFGFMPRA
jgi:hypothetical protein